ncbi:GDSL esterase/lipase At5g03610-like isoform X3 [Quercus robur]|uniref:GDSL esterase/lipase At5g03610-like isoform X3 n=1 Tax=Quercus robur TaxID=38942 RepID=UPI002163B059|nr:GDSL esterase/lipase At5g03610-like isoform X3 [Quercus robur]
MDAQKLLFTVLCFFLLFLLSGEPVVQARLAHHHHHRLFNFRPSKLFVFGDSYADTGNNKKSEANSWKYPYGITFPGKPAGRYSDGRVLTDFLAKFIGLKSPIPYRLREYGVNDLKYGMNFAFGGTGVFNTLVSDPNMTTQIDFFHELIKTNAFNATDVESSVALVTLSGNDYSAYEVKNGTAQGFPSFITSVVKQLKVNLKRIHGLGVKKIAVTALQPLGCLPRSTIKSSFQQCNGTENSLVSFHNLLLQQAVAKLNNETKVSTFVILNLYDSFMSVLKNKGDQTVAKEMRVLLLALVLMSVKGQTEMKWGLLVWIWRLRQNWEAAEQRRLRRGCLMMELSIQKLSVSQEVYGCCGMMIKWWRN